MKYDSDFNKDLNFGKEAEALTLKTLKQKYPKAYIKKGYHKEYDIIVPELDNQTIEVKYDRQTDGPDKHTGNLFVECESRGRKSGIETTTANWYFYWYSNLNKLVRVETNSLKKLIKENNFRKVNGGDSQTSKGYLIPVKLFEEK